MKISTLDFNPNDEGFNGQRYLNSFYNGRYDEFDIKKETIDLEHAANLLELEIEKIDRYNEPYHSRVEYK